MENKINKSKVLLLGGVGFIGHHLALRLVEEGHEVVVADGFKINSILNFYVDEKNREHSVYNDFLLERVKLLKEAGYTSRNTDGWLVHQETGRVLSFEMGIQKTSAYMVTPVQQMLKEHGEMKEI